MKAFPLFLLLSWTTLYAQSPANSQPLTPEEKRVILIQLLELRSCREQVATFNNYITRDAEQDAKDKALADRELALEKRATALAEKERDMYKDKASFYEQSYNALKKKPGFGCTLKKVFSLGIARCS